MIADNNIPHFQNYILNYYRYYGRHELPWRLTTDPYQIMVSEIMLQQTQVDRVIPKYNTFIKKFPTIQTLANASFDQVLSLWMGLGYNRRAKFLHQCAQVVDQAQTPMPTSHASLLKLPGIGSYTASAIQAFAYNQPTTIIETNIRTVYFYHFFDQTKKISDKDLTPIVEATQLQSNPRVWYWALMDYGAYLKKVHGNFNSRSKHYTKQSKFEGSNRQTRAQILRLLLQKPLTKFQINSQTPKDPQVIQKILTQLQAENLIIKEHNHYKII